MAAIGPSQRSAFLDALGNYIDARIEYHAAEPEWRSNREVAQAIGRLDEALVALFIEPELHRG